MLDEAATVSSMLFLDEGDMSQRYRKAYDREDALDSAPAADASGQVSQATNPASASFGSAGSLFFRATSEPETGSGFPEGGGGGILAAAAAAGGGRANVPLGAVERRPEEKLFCDALLDLQSLTVRMCSLICVQLENKGVLTFFLLLVRAMVLIGGIRFCGIAISGWLLTADQAASAAVRVDLGPRGGRGGVPTTGMC